jgi:hypothetical protein
MSASNFYRQHALLMRPGTSADHAERMHEAYEAVRDQWIAERRFTDLVKAILANWTSGNCVAYMAPLSEALVAAGEFELHRHLWSRTVKRQVATFFHVLGSVDRQKAQYLRLLNLDTQGFVETDVAAYAKPERAAAFLLQRLSADLHRWKNELRVAGLPTEEPEQVERSLLLLKIPRIRVNKLPPATRGG